MFDEYSSVHSKQQSSVLIYSAVKTAVTIFKPRMKVCTLNTNALQAITSVLQNMHVKKMDIWLKETLCFCLEMYVGKCRQMMTCLYVNTLCWLLQKYHVTL